MKEGDRRGFAPSGKWPQMKINSPLASSSSETG